MDKIRLEPRLYRIFEDHREMYQQFKKLLVACAQGEGLHTMGGLFKHIQGHMEPHFQLEESLMHPDYAETAAHKQAHLALRQDFAHLVQEFEHTGATHQMMGKLTLFTLQWLVEHEQGLDHPLEKHLVEHSLEN